MAAREFVSNHIQQLVTGSSPLPANPQLSLGEYHLMGKKGCLVGEEAVGVISGLVPPMYSGWGLRVTIAMRAVLYSKVQDSMGLAC